MSDKQWGNVPYFGLSSDWDPDWVLTARQQELRDILIELCESDIRANAAVSDEKLE